MILFLRYFQQILHSKHKHNVMSCPTKNFNRWFPYLKDSYHFVKFGYLPINLGVSYTYFFNLHEEDKTK